VGYSLQLSTPFTLGDVGIIVNAYQTLRFCFVVACLIITQYTEYDIILANGFEKLKAPPPCTAEPKVRPLLTLKRGHENCKYCKNVLGLYAEYTPSVLQVPSYLRSQ
jgi:hypothetical protein